MNPQQKPVRVETATVRVFQCPVCEQEVHGTVEVAIRLGTVTLVPTIGDGDDTGLEATATATTEMRGLRVNHQCTGGGMAYAPES